MPLGIALSLSGCASPASNSPPAANTTPAAPPEWRHTTTRDFDHDFPGQGLGVARRFDSEDGWTDVYIYDLGRSWLDGRQDAQFPDAFAAACDDIRATAAAGNYVDFRADAPTDGLAGGLPIRSARFTYRHRDRQIESHLIMTCAHGRMIKARASFFVPVSDAARSSVLSLIQQQIRLID